MTKSIKVNKDTTSSIASGITGASSDLRLSPLAVSYTHLDVYKRQDFSITQGYRAR